jgi:small subunit ribosomal protein S17e
MDRVRRISTDLLEKYADKFSISFDANKRIVQELAVVRSKVLRNKIAGFITSYLRKNASVNQGTSDKTEDEATNKIAEDEDKNLKT